MSGIDHTSFASNNVLVCLFPNLVGQCSKIDILTHRHHLNHSTSSFAYFLKVDPAHLLPNVNYSAVSSNFRNTPHNSMITTVMCFFSGEAQFSQKQGHEWITISNNSLPIISEAIYRNLWGDLIGLLQSKPIHAPTLKTICACDTMPSKERYHLYIQHID